MFLEIISPEKVLFKGEVSSVIAPGSNGEFQILNNHAAILSTLVNGVVKFEVNKNDSDLNVSEDITKNGSVYSLDIKGGVLEMNDNKVIVLPS